MTLVAASIRCHLKHLRHQSRLFAENRIFLLENEDLIAAPLLTTLLTTIPPIPPVPLLALHPIHPILLPLLPLPPLHHHLHPIPNTIFPMLRKTGKITSKKK